MLLKVKKMQCNFRFSFILYNYLTSPFSFLYVLGKKVKKYECKNIKIPVVFFSI
jgi:hypothetical protein